MYKSQITHEKIGDKTLREHDQALASSEISKEVQRLISSSPQLLTKSLNQPTFSSPNQLFSAQLQNFLF